MMLLGLRFGFERVARSLAAVVLSFSITHPLDSSAWLILFPFLPLPRPGSASERCRMTPTV